MRTKRKTVDDTATKAVLMEAMDEETADAVIDQRKAIKEPMTALGARRFIKQWNLIPETKRQDALELWAVNNWRGFEAEWFTRPSRFEDRRHPSPKQGGAPVTFTDEIKPVQKPSPEERAAAVQRARQRLHMVGGNA
jgi:hypothetical protein